MKKLIRKIILWALVEEKLKAKVILTTNQDYPNVIVFEKENT
ncbi:hypothetical protein [Erysipelothrix larvae]|nr:hypothetical protein [Erysipelothrix larvae]